jgi:hypothetical protein
VLSRIWGKEERKGILRLLLPKLLSRMKKNYLEDTSEKIAVLQDRLKLKKGLNLV